VVKRTPVNDFENIRTSGIKAITLRENDELLNVRLTNGERDIIIGASNGKAIRFAEEDVRAMGRTASGVRGILLAENEEVVGFTVVDGQESQILFVTENGYGKRTDVEEYRQQKRGGKGVKTLNITEKNGALAKLRSVSGDEDVIITTTKGTIIRLPIEQISVSKRATQGVRLIKLNEGHKVATIAIVPKQEEEEDLVEGLEEGLDINHENKIPVQQLMDEPLEEEEEQEEQAPLSLFDTEER
jgi:DNA gyrase subunit A